MSSTVFSSGYMAPLTKPIGNYKQAGWEEFSEKLYEEGLQVNYEGTLVFSDTGRRNRNDDYLYGFSVANVEELSKFYEILQKLGIEITHEIQFYACVWHDGTDSEMSDLTLEKFLKLSGQTPEYPTMLEELEALKSNLAADALYNTGVEEALRVVRKHQEKEKANG